MDRRLAGMLAKSWAWIAAQGGKPEGDAGPQLKPPLTSSLQIATNETSNIAIVGDKPARILVVDDHVMNRQAITLMLAPIGVIPTLADSAETALDLLASEAFDVVLMDIYMPGLDGREATRRLRAQVGPNQAIPVIAVTASATPRDREDSQNAGITHHVAKPISPAALYAALEQALDAGLRGAVRAA